MKTAMFAQAHRQQRGSTLIVGLVMLVLMTLVALAAINMSTGTLKIVGNMQYQQEARAAAQAAINQVLSSAAYMKTPSSSPTLINVVVNGTTYHVALTQPCIKSVSTISVAEIDQGTDSLDQRICKDEDDKYNTGILSQRAGEAGSHCSRLIWEITATVTDTNSRAHVELTEGAATKEKTATAEAWRTDSTRVCSI
jgi:Tfp pilus assembly protein PilX